MLKKHLNANAYFSFVSALALLIFPSQIGDFIGVSEVGILRLLGISLVVWAAIVYYISHHKSDNTTWVSIVTMGDFARVMLSIYVISSQMFGLTITGYVVIGIVALIVLYFGIMQLRHNAYT